MAMDCGLPWLGLFFGVCFGKQVIHLFLGREAAAAIPHIGDKARILELVNTGHAEVFELRQQTFNLQREIANLKNPADTDKKRRELIASLKHNRNVYWEDDKPYCVACIHTDAHLAPLSCRGEMSTNGQCPVYQVCYDAVFG